MKTKNVAIIITILLSAFLGAAGVRAADATATVDCKETGRLNGQVQYQYEVTLSNNTAKKLTVEYDVILVAGSVPSRDHRHSTLLSPNEKNLTETHDGVMSAEGWDKITRFRIEWTSREL